MLHLLLTDWHFIKTPNIIFMQFTLLQKLDSFLQWLKENHPIIYGKYHQNFGIPMTETGGITVNNSYQLSTDDMAMLHKIAKSYYETEHP